MLRLHIFIIFPILVPMVTAKEQPRKQPFCKIHPQGFYFYRNHYTKMYRYKCWFCLESYEDRIKLCADIYARSANRLVETYEIPALPVTENKYDNVEVINEQDMEDNDGDDDGVEEKCKRRSMIWYEPNESSMEDLLFKKEVDKPKLRLSLDTFKCPITRMNVTFKPKERKSAGTARKSLINSNEFPMKDVITDVDRRRPVPGTRDFFISYGRNLITVAILVNSVKGNNLCLYDVIFYEEADPKIDACFLKNKEWVN